MPEDREIEATDSVGLGGSVAPRGSVNVSSRHYEAGLHLWSARHYARLCTELESKRQSEAPLIDIQHRAYASSAVLSSAVFLESLVNEVFQDVADATAGQVSLRIEPLGERAIALMGGFWNASEQGGRYVGVLDKFQMALLFAEKQKLDRGANPYQDAKLLVDIRNKLVHFRPAWRTPSEETQLEQVLKTKFPENALLAGSGNSWFPHKCLGAGCAQWSWRTARAIADEWTDRLGITRFYGEASDLANEWPTP